MSSRISSTAVPSAFTSMQVFQIYTPLFIFPTEFQSILILGIFHIVVSPAS